MVGPRTAATSTKPLYVIPGAQQASQTAQPATLGIHRLFKNYATPIIFVVIKD